MPTRGGVSGSPVIASQTLAVLSSLAVTTRRLSGLYETALMAALCTRALNTRCPSSVAPNRVWLAEREKVWRARHRAYGALISLYSHARA